MHSIPPTHILSPPQFCNPQFPSLFLSLSLFFSVLFRSFNRIPLLGLCIDLMPHAEKATMGEVTVNGEKVRHSQFLDHLTSYPLISDSITTFKGNKYAAKSLHYADQGYTRLAKPVLPYLSKPYSYVSPYLARADTLGDKGLSRIDTRFPIIKEDTDKLKTTIYDGAQGSVGIVVDVKGHLVELYGTEYKKCGGDGLVASGKAVITTGLILSQESLAYVSSLLQTKKEQAKDDVQEKEKANIE